MVNRKNPFPCADPPLGGRGEARRALSLCQIPRGSKNLVAKYSHLLIVNRSHLLRAKRPTHFLTPCKTHDAPPQPRVKKSPG